MPPSAAVEAEGRANWAYGVVLCQLPHLRPACRLALSLVQSPGQAASQSGAGQLASCLSHREKTGVWWQAEDALHRQPIPPPVGAAQLPG